MYPLLWITGIIGAALIGVTLWACIAAPMGGNWTPDVGVGIGLVIFLPLMWAFKKMMEDD